MVVDEQRHYRFISCHMLCLSLSTDLLLFFQDYLLSHMYSNAARDDLWSKLSQVSLT